MDTGKGLISGLFWGGAVSMVLLTAASVYFPLRDLSDHAARGTQAAGAEPQRPETRPFLADPPAALVGPDGSPPAGTGSDTPPEAAPEDLARAESGPVLPGTESEPPAPPATEEGVEAQALAPLAGTETPGGPAHDGSVEVDLTAPPVATGAPPDMLVREVATLPQPLKDGGPRPSDTDVPGRSPLGGLPPVASAPEAAPDLPPGDPRLRPPAPPASLALDDLWRPEAGQGAGGPADFARPERFAGLAPVMPPPGLSPPSGQVPEAPRAAAAPVGGPSPMVEPGLPDGAARAPAPDEALSPPARRTAASPPILQGDETRAPVPPRAAPVVTSRPPGAPRPPATPDAPRAAEAPEAVGDAPRAADPGALPVPEPDTRQAALPEGAPDPAGAATGGLPAASPRVLLGSGSDTLVSRGPGLSARLPRIGDPAPQPASAVPDLADPPAVGALSRNARSFEAPAGAALVAVVLDLSRGAPDLRDALLGAGAPLAVALDPSRPEAPAQAAELRAAGHEVLIALTGLPPVPEPRDIDVALTAHIARLPGAVGVWLPADSPAFTDRTLLRHTVAVLSDTGHGLVTPRSGLDAAGQEARSAGLPAVSVSRRLEAGDPDAVMRGLAQGALRAAAAGRYVLQAEPRADTLAALTGWGMGLTGQSLALAPVSTLLLSPDL